MKKKRKEKNRNTIPSQLLFTQKKKKITYKKQTKGQTSINRHSQRLSVFAPFF